MSTTTIHRCDACDRELTSGGGPLRAHAVKIIIGHGVHHDRARDPLLDAWVGDLCETCAGNLTIYAKHHLGKDLE